MTDSPLKVWRERDETLLRLRLARPKANIIDAAMIAALDKALIANLDDPKLSAVLLDQEGPHFSFGASVQEHLPDQCGDMIRSLHAMLLRMIESPIPILVAVKGQCLGGGLEVAIAGHLLFTTPDAKLGQPEVQLAVIAPAASTILPERMFRGAAEDMLFSGRSISGEEGYRSGLVQALSPDPEAAALAYFDDNLARLSSSSLRWAVKVARLDMVERVRAKLAAVENLYLTGLMSTRDAVEGLTAFLDKRPAKWEGR